MTDQLDEDQLRRLARELNYETTTLVGQLVALHSGIFVHGTPVYMALVEAPLVHLRLLDEFCWRAKPGPKGDDIYARLYLADWQSKGFLHADTERGPINAQLQHLARRRTNGYQWRFGDLIESCARELRRFITEHDEAHPERPGWFDPSQDALEWVLHDGLPGPHSQGS